MIRDLYYYMYIGSSLDYFNNLEIHDFTKLNLDLLNHYNHIFNGEKIINISLDENLINFDINHIVEKYPIFQGAKVNKILNHNVSRESLHFIETINQFKKEEGRMLFYAHSKAQGVPNPITEYKNMSNWVNAMYYFNLNEEYIPEIEKELESKLFSGCLRITTACPPWVESNWHYSGTFFWMNSNKVLNQNFDWFDKNNKYSVESFPGNVISVENSHSTFISEDHNFVTYNESIWNYGISPNYLGEEKYLKYINHYNYFVDPIKKKYQ